MATCCQYYCFGLSVFSAVFLLYLCVMIGMGSQTIYIEVHNHASSAVALFVAALIYAGIAGYHYYNIFMNVDRREELKRWILERRNQNHIQMSSSNRANNEPRHSDSRL